MLDWFRLLVIGTILLTGLLGLPAWFGARRRMPWVAHVLAALMFALMATTALWTTEHDPEINWPLLWFSPAAPVMIYLAFIAILDGRTGSASKGR